MYNLKTEFNLLLQDHVSLSDDLDNLSSSHSKVRTESIFQSKRLQGKLTLTVGNFSIEDVKGISNKSAKNVLLSPVLWHDRKNTIHILDAHPTVKNIIVWTNDIVKQQSELLKQDFSDLLNTLSSLNTEVFISVPLPPVRIDPWIVTACTFHTIHLIDKFNFFWDSRHLFRAEFASISQE